MMVRATPDWQSDDGAIQLYCGDCLDVLPALDGVDAVVTDPPYGLGEARKDHKSRNRLAFSPNYERSSWDDKPADAQAIELIRQRSKTQVIFGGNYFHLPPSRCWFVWDKVNGDNDFADCELAWTNVEGAVRIIRHMWAGMLRDSERDEPRIHPTQKPVAVMSWALQKAKVPHGALVCDPYMGSGTTGVACVLARCRFVGIEADRNYFSGAVKRIQRAIEDQRLLTLMERAS